jgi:AcrR family transcriptional regulator
MELKNRNFSKKTVGKLGTRKKGLETRQRIIDVARNILIEQGYENFVLRNVALEANIKPGNLQYYFASKKELLAAVLLPEIGRYEDIYSQFSERGTGVDRIVSALVDFLLKEIKLKSTTNIWYVVWAQSAHDDDLAEMMDEWYAEYMGSLKALFQHIVPGISSQRAGHAASILTAVMDGLTNQIGHARKRHRIHDKIDQTVKQTLLDILQS